MKTFTIIELSLMVAVAGVLFYNKAKSTPSATGNINPAFGEYISSYTTGVVSSGSPFPTSPDAPTGNWTARIKVGDAQFTHNYLCSIFIPNFAVQLSA